jgi:hypothetical protein
VLSEDGAIVELGPRSAVVWPGARGVKVKGELAPVTQASGPGPVAAVCHLAERGAKLAIRLLPPAEAVPALVPSLIHAGGPESLGPSFAQLVRLVERVPVYRVTMPDGLSRASEALRELLAEIAP